MTILNILSKEEIQLFESPPRFTSEERKHFFNLPEWAEKQIKMLTTSASKIGFILQLGYFRATGKFYTKDLFYSEDSEFIQKRLEIEGIWQATQYSERMTERHRILILAKLGYSAYSPTAATILSAEAASAVEKQLRLKDIFGKLLELLEQKRIEVPRYYVLSSIITRAFRQYEKQILSRLAACLTEAQILQTCF